MREPNYIPKPSLHHSGQAVLRLNGKDHYLGRYGSAEAQAKYEALIGAWLNNGRCLPSQSASATINNVILGYVRHVDAYYPHDARGGSREVGCIKDALRIVRSLYGQTPAAEFGPKKLKAVRKAMISKCWCRSYINHQVDRVRRMFRWATSEELVSGDVYHALQAVESLRRGTPGVRESKKVKPAPEELIETAKLHMLPPVRALVELQLLTAMRPTEACLMRACDIDMTGRVWIYKPLTHKTEHHGHERYIYVGPKAQEIIKPWLKLDPTAYLFSPAEAEAARNANRRKNRKTPLWPSHIRMQAKKRKRKSKRTLGDHYDVHSYRRAIKRACEQAYPLPDHLARRRLPDGRLETHRAWRARLTDKEKSGIRTWRREHSWHPHQLRHNAATNLRKEYGIELARIILGHTTAFTTEIYAEMDRMQAVEVMAKIG